MATTPSQFQRGDRVTHDRRGPGTFIEPASPDTALVALDEERVDGRVLGDALSLDGVAEVSQDRLSPA